jgi:hypothetical protein
MEVAVVVASTVLEVLAAAAMVVAVLTPDVVALVTSYEREMFRVVLGVQMELGERT